jgi:hypothetical protein
MTDQAQEPARAYIRPRPIRVAYLLADDEHAHVKLDGAFASSYAHWGGRFSLICPCENGYPRESYMPWLRVFDPDVIYSFIDLSDDNLRRIRESFGPAYLVRHGENLKGAPTSHDFRVTLPITPLVSLSTTPQYARAFPASAPQPVRVVDYLPGQPNDRRPPRWGVKHEFETCQSRGVGRKSGFRASLGRGGIWASATAALLPCAAASPRATTWATPSI